MSSRIRRGSLVSAILALLGGCGGWISGADAEAPPFPECEAAAYAFAGEASLASLGLADLWPEEAARVGEIWVTAVPPNQFGPPGAPPMNDRVVCVEFADGSGMAGPIPDDWQPATGGLGLPTDGVSVLAPLAVIVMIAVVGGASVLAFRGRGPSST